MKDMFTIETVTSWAKQDLKFAQSDYLKSPSSVRWNLTLRAMFVYQQADFASRSATVDRKQLLADLFDQPLGAWGDIITKATTGKSVRDNLIEFGTAGF